MCSFFFPVIKFSRNKKKKILVTFFFVGCCKECVHRRGSGVYGGFALGNAADDVGVRGAAKLDLPTTLSLNTHTHNCSGLPQTQIHHLYIMDMDSCNLLRHTHTHPSLQSDTPMQGCMLLPISEGKWGGGGGKNWLNEKLKFPPNFSVTVGRCHRRCAKTWELQERKEKKNLESSFCSTFKSSLGN